MRLRVHLNIRGASNGRPSRDGRAAWTPLLYTKMVKMTMRQGLLLSPQNRFVGTKNTLKDFKNAKNEKKKKKFAQNIFCFD